MSAARVEAAALLLISPALAGACDRSPVDTSPAPVRAAAEAIVAADPACALPLARFSPSRMQLTGTMLDYPTNVVLIDRAGQLRWNGVAVEPPRLAEYIDYQARTAPPPILVIQPDRDAPCAVVRETISVAIGSGRCTPRTCAFQWPGTDAPPLLPERAKLLGPWLLVSIDGAPPPRQAPPIELTFTDGAVVARSQCVSYNWLIGEADGRLRLRVPPGPVAMCARATSPWEDRFGAAMAAAVTIESAGETLIVTGAKGKLILKRPD